MTSTQRHRLGNPEVRTAPVLAATVIEVGDILWYDASNNCVKPASDYTWDTNLATTQGSFKDVFVGIARSAHAAGVAGSVTYCTRGVFEMDCASAAFDMGVYVAPADSGSSTLEDQKVVSVTTDATKAIGKTAKQTATATKVYVEIKSTIHHDGPQTIT